MCAGSLRMLIANLTTTQMQLITDFTAVQTLIRFPNI